MDDVELKNIKLQFPSSLRLAINEVDAIDQRVRTDRGDIVVAVQGDRTKPAILTYHDIGVNYTSFLPFFSYAEMRALAQNFCVFHVNAPGQEDGAPTLPDDFAYPSLEEMANQLNYVLAHFGLKTFIGFGVGAGAHVLAKFAITNPDKVSALALVNCSSYQSGWVEWAYQKMNARSLRARGMTQAVLDYLMWYHFGRSAEERNPDLATLYRNHFARNVNPANLAHYIEAFNRRGDLGIARDGATLRPPVLNVTGAMSPHVDETVAFNARLNPNNSTWMKIQDCGLVIEEQPAKISEAFRLFLQGEGYVETHACALLSQHGNGTSYLQRSYLHCYSHQEVQGDGECCAICIEPYKVSETLRSLPCRHDFHKNCIDPWLLEHRTCPMCKMDILKYYGFVFTGSQESILQLEVEESRSRALSPARNRHPLTLLTSDNSYSEAGSGRSSRASSPDELAPSLPRDNACSRDTSHDDSSSFMSCAGSPSSPRADNAQGSSFSSSSSE